MENREQPIEEGTEQEVRKGTAWALHGVLFTVIAIVIGMRAFSAPIKKEVVAPVGEGMPDASVFLTTEGKEITYATQEEAEAYAQRKGIEMVFADTDTLGAYPVFLRYNGKTYESLLLVEDTTPPVIEGVEDRTATAGKPFAFKKGVVVSDNYDTDLTFDVDASGVDLNNPGTYIVIYNAKDAAGNKTTTGAFVHVVEDIVPVLPDRDEKLYDLADDILKDLINDEMTMAQKAETIFDYVHGIEYEELFEENDAYEDALRGLTERTGDCSVYAMTAKVLLARAGIPNLDIVNVPEAMEHAWNLIDIGEGWHHFDATRRIDGARLFYLTDEELQEYSRTHGNTHVYDASRYPEIQ